METVPFEPRDIYITGEEERREPYRKDAYYDGKTAKCGQMKLLIGEILFLLNHWDTTKYPEIVLVVAGGASGEHYAPLLDMFPGIVRVDLWDGPTREFALENTSVYEEGRVRIIKEYMTEETLGDMYNGASVFFVSDIRTMNKGGVSLDDMAMDQRESTVRGDTELQSSLVRMINPIECLLKFRVPYPSSDSDKYSYISYFKGVIYGQCFASPNTAEMRLVPVRENGEYVYTKYGNLDFEQRMSYYNNKVRMRRNTEYSNTINGDVDINDMQLVASFDTCYMLYVFDKYLYSVGYNESDGNKRFTKAHGMWNWAINRVMTYQKTSSSCNMNRYRTRKLTLKKTKYPYIYEEKVKAPEPKAIPHDILELMKTTRLALEPTLSIREGAPLTFKKRVVK